MKRKFNDEESDEGPVSSIAKRTKFASLDSPAPDVIAEEDPLNHDDGTTSSSSPSSDAESELASSEDASSEDLSDDEDSGLSTSDEESSSEEDSSSDSDDIVNVQLREQPSIQPTFPSQMKSRLSSFLPALAKANASLERDLEEGQLEGHFIDQVEEDEEQYIEMVCSTSIHYAINADNTAESRPGSAEREVQR
jgi:hypothetical protein